MATAIRSMNNLTRVVGLRVQQALKMTQQEIFETIQKHIIDYYHEFSPVMYERTWHFLNSLIKPEIVKSSNGISCSVEIDRDYLSYNYKGGATGLDVATYANQHSHGGIFDDDFGQFWNDSMQVLGMRTGILAIMKKNLKKCGVPIN